MLKTVKLLILLICLSACTPWPSIGTGGYAQHYIFTPEYACKLNPRDKHYCIYPKLVKLNQQLNHIRSTRMGLCYPAYTAMLRKDIDYAAQQFASGHFDLSINCINKLVPNVSLLDRLVKKSYCLKNIPQFSRYRRAPCDL